jgi:hypothetical protein
MDNLVGDIAYRYSDYSTVGGQDTYRIGLDWQPIEMARIRAGYNRAVRAPNVAELYSVNNLGLWAGVDPCATASPSTQQNSAHALVSLLLNTATSWPAQLTSTTRSAAVTSI